MESTTHSGKMKILALEKRIKELEELKKEKEDQFSHIVQMLILDYLGLGIHIDNNSKKAEIYAPLIRRNVETTRQYFSKLNSEKTPQNLTIILNYFKKTGLSEKMELVQKDLDRK
jgi:hypothetical protein